MSDDRLAEIKAVVAGPYYGYTVELDYEQSVWLIAEVVALRSRCEAAEAATEAVQKRRIEMREQVAAWMIEQGFATGHGDSVKSLLGQLTWQIEALRVRAGIADELAAALEGVRAINTAYRTGSQPSGKALDAANKAADALARWAASGVSEQADKGDA